MKNELTDLLNSNIALLQETVYTILCDHDLCIREYDLLLKLKEMDIPYFNSASFSDTLELYRCHFVLFHILYSLRDKLFSEKSQTLEIHCLEIKIVPHENNAVDTPAYPDFMREYYMDLGNLRNCSRQDAENLVKDFWKMFYSLDNQSDALTILGLHAPVTENEIKQRYRALVREHHPDFGGDPARFREIEEAAALLLDP